MATTQADAELAHSTAYSALKTVERKTLRQVLAGSITAYMMGDGRHGRARWAQLAAGEGHFDHVVRSSVRDLPENVVVSSGPVGDAVKAAARALLEQA